MSRLDEIWDEFRWEAFMSEQDRKLDRYMELFYGHRNDPGRDELIARELNWQPWLEGAEEEGAPEDEPEEGEEWKSAAGVDDAAGEPTPEESDLLRATGEMAVNAIRFAEALPEAMRETSSVVDYVSSAAIAGAKIACGTGMCDDLDALGCNIAFCKRGLAAANHAIAALREMKAGKVVSPHSYRALAAEAVEVRDLIALHILRLRERFRSLSESLL